jgi:molybdenum cofactor biosynthesis enzyme
MCKSIDRSMVIDEVRLVRKSGGESGLYERAPGV